MATFVKRGASIRAVIRLAGQSAKTKTFATKQEAQKWAALVENTERARAQYTAGQTLGELFTRYLKEVESKKNYKGGGVSQYKSFARQFNLTPLKDCDETWWHQTIREWDVSPSGRLTYAGRISGVLKYAHYGWRLRFDYDGFKAAVKALRAVGLVKAGRARTRCFTPEEIELIKSKRAEAAHTIFPLNDIIDFALVLGFRAGEIMRIRWADVDRGAKSIIVRARKHPTKKEGNDKVIPLICNALEIIERQPRVRRADGSLDPRIFPFNSGEVGKSFIETAKRAGVVNGTFHDLRHTALTRLFDMGFSIEEVAMISGHEDWKILKKYTHINPLRLLQGPISHRKAA